MKTKYLYTIVAILACGVVYFVFGTTSKEALTVDSNLGAMDPTATTGASTTEAKFYTLQEISLHNNRTDCWMAINGDVLDTTDFISKHPGGERIIEGCGKDATPLFNQIPGHATKSVVKLLMKKMKIGELAK